MSRTRREKRQPLDLLAARTSTVSDTFRKKRKFVALTPATAVMRVRRYCA